MTIWTDEQNERLKTLYQAGLSCSRIAHELKGGFSRNAVISKVHRLGLEPRGNGGNYSGNGRGPVLRSAEAKSKPRIRITRANTNSNAHRLFLTREPLELKALRCAEIVPLLIGLLDLESEHCRYPYGDRDVTYCGHPKTVGSYCLSHFALTHGAGTASERAASTAPSLVPA